MKSSLSLVTAPATLPVTVAEMKAYLKVDGSDEDTLIEALINVAVERVEQYIDKKLIKQKWAVYFDHFPCTKKKDMWVDGVIDASVASVLGGASPIINLPIGVMMSLEEFNTYADDDVKVSSSVSDFTVDTEGPFGRVCLKQGGVWPTTVLRGMNGIEIIGFFGYGEAASDVPNAIKNAIKVLVGKLFEDRGDDKDGEMGGMGAVAIPKTAMFLLEPHRSVKVGLR